MTPLDAREAVQDILFGTFIAVSFITKWVQVRFYLNRSSRYPKRGRRGHR